MFVSFNFGITSTNSLLTVLWLSPQQYKQINFLLNPSFSAYLHPSQHVGFSLLAHAESGSGGFFVGVFGGVFFRLVGSFFLLGVGIFWLGFFGKFCLVSSTF